MALYPLARTLILPTSSPSTPEVGSDRESRPLPDVGPQTVVSPQRRGFAEGPRMAASLSLLESVVLGFSVAHYSHCSPEHCRTGSALKFLDSVSFSHFPFSELGFEQKLNKSLNLRRETQKTLPGFSNPCLK